MRRLEAEVIGPEKKVLGTFLLTESGLFCRVSLWVDGDG